MDETDLAFEVGQLKSAVKALTISVKSLDGTVRELTLWKAKIVATCAAVSFIVACLFEMGKLYVMAAK